MQTNNPKPAPKSIAIPKPQAPKLQAPLSMRERAHQKAKRGFLETGKPW